MFKKLVVGLLMVGLILGSISMKSTGFGGGGYIVISRRRRAIREANISPVVFYQCSPDVEIDPRKVCLCYTRFTQYDQEGPLKELFFRCNKDIREKIKSGQKYRWIKVWKEKLSDSWYIWFKYIWIE